LITAWIRTGNANIFSHSSNVLPNNLATGITPPNLIQPKDVRLCCFLGNGSTAAVITIYTALKSS
jgi:hypothetical protein